MLFSTPNCIRTVRRRFITPCKRRSQDGFRMDWLCRRLTPGRTQSMMLPTHSYPRPATRSSRAIPLISLRNGATRTSTSGSDSRSVTLGPCPLGGDTGVCPKERSARSWRAGKSVVLRHFRRVSPLISSRTWTRHTPAKSSAQISTRREPLCPWPARARRQVRTPGFSQILHSAAEGISGGTISTVQAPTFCFCFFKRPPRYQSDSDWTSESKFITSSIVCSSASPTTAFRILRPLANPVRKCGGPMERRGQGRCNSERRSGFRSPPLSLGAGVWLGPRPEVNGYVGRALAFRRSVVPLFHCARRGLDQNRIAAEGLNVLHRSIRADRNAKLDRAANSLVAQDGRVFRLDLFQDFAVSVLRKNHVRAAYKDGNQAGHL